MKRSSRPRRTSNLSESVHRQLNMYALAASAAGVSLLALAEPADAKIVYTPANVQLGRTPFALDLNHDGVVDFVFVQYFVRNSGGTNSLSVCHATFYAPGFNHCVLSTTNSPNAVRGIGSMHRVWGAALRYGTKIQRGDKFLSKHAVGMGRLVDPVSGPLWYGPWLDGGKGVKHHYLGVKFEINGRFHFGWARITVTTTRNTFTATLTGYAYETIPGKAIIAGATKWPDDEAQPAPASIKTDTPEPATLGMLALGAPGLSIWRREESVFAAPTSDRP